MQAREFKTLINALDDHVEIFVNNHHQESKPTDGASIRLIGNVKDKTQRIIVELNEKYD